MTNHWVDIKNADVILIMGGNAAEAHPCGFKWVTEAKAHRKARLIVVDPRFTRSAAMSDLYAPIRVGTDIAFLGGVIHHLFANNKLQMEYIKAHTNASFIVGEAYSLTDGIYSGYDADKRKYDPASWGYEMGADGFAKVDPTLEHPRCVFQILKKHYERYTPELVGKICGTPAAEFRKVCEMIAGASTRQRNMTILYALGWTHHSQGSEIIRTGAILQLLLGNIGVAGGGMNALRGHSNIQGLTDLGLLSTQLPGYLKLPTESDVSYDGYITRLTPKALRPNSTNYWGNYPKFHVSLMKAWYGKAATKENDWAYNYLPRYDVEYDIIRTFDLMYDGKINGYICQGFNPLSSFPDTHKILAALSKLKFLVIIDPLQTETSNFWQDHGEFNDVKTEEIQTEVFRLPVTCFAEEEGSLTNSSRWLQWHYKGAEPPGEAKGDPEIVAELFLRIRELYARDGGVFPDPIRDLTWNYKIPHSPAPEELAQEYNGRALEDLVDPKNKDVVLAKKGELLPGFALLRDDGTTSSGCWIYAGAWTEKGNMMARRDNSDPYGLGQTLNWAFAWPVNRRVLYNRASADAEGKPWDPSRKMVYWNGEKIVGSDVPDIRPDANPADGVGAFIMNPEGVARLFAPTGMAEGPLPEHYEPFESPVKVNHINPGKAMAFSNPAARMFRKDRDKLGTPEEFPYAATSYGMTEHFHGWTKHLKGNAIIQPEQFVEIGDELAREKGIANGDRIRVRSKRGQIEAVAVVTRRLRALDCGGTRVHQVGLPNHWGFMGLARKGFSVNTLSPSVGDANTQTPEYKAFTVNIEKA